MTNIIDLKLKNYNPYCLYQERIRDLKDLISLEFNETETINVTIEYNKKREPIGGSGISNAPHGVFDQINITFPNKHIVTTHKKKPYKIEILMQEDEWYVILPASRNILEMTFETANQVQFASKRAEKGFREYVYHRTYGGYRYITPTYILKGQHDQVGYAVINEYISWENSIMLGYYGNDYSNNKIIDIIKEMMDVVKDTSRSKIKVVNKPLPAKKFNSNSDYISSIKWS